MIGRIGVCAGLFGGGLWWSGLVSSSTATYALPASEVHARLERAGLPPLVFGEEQPDSVVHSAPDQIAWEVDQDGSEVMRYVIDVTPVDGSHTRVRIGLKGATQGKFGNVEERVKNDATLRNLYLTAMKEQVDSVLTGHPFRYSAISGATTAATVAHMGQIADWMDRAADAQHKRERENMEKAYRDAGLD